MNFLQAEMLLLALGSNTPGRWGTPRETLARACRELAAAGLEIEMVSHVYVTDAVGSGRQGRYLNAVLVARGRKMAPGGLLRLLKRLERRAGRRTALPMRPRPLDIDVLDYGGRRLNWPAGRRERGRLVLPHPEAPARAFVLVPLAEVAPCWVHPGLRLPARTLLARLPPRARRGVRGALDFRLGACDKAVR